MGVLGLLKFLDFELLKNTVVIFVHRVSFVCPSFVRCVSAVCPSFVPSVSLVSLVSFVSFVSFVCPLYVLRVSAGMSSGVPRCPQVSAGVPRCPQVSAGVHNVRSVRSVSAGMSSGVRSVSAGMSAVSFMICGHLRTCPLQTMGVPGLLSQPFLSLIF